MEGVLPCVSGAFAGRARAPRRAQARRAWARGRSRVLGPFCTCPLWASRTPLGRVMSGWSQASFGPLWRDSCACASGELVPTPALCWELQQWGLGAPGRAGQCGGGVGRSGVRRRPGGPSRRLAQGLAAAVLPRAHTSQRGWGRRSPVCGRSWRREALRQPQVLVATRACPCTEHACPTSCLEEAGPYLGP